MNLSQGVYEVISYRLSDVDRVGVSIAAMLRVGDIVGLSGGLGAGKTTLARAILQALGLASEAPSPTFAIIQPYAPPEVTLPLVHGDFYRIDNPQELEELGLDDYLYEAAVLIEWPERVGAGRYPDMLRLTIGNVEAEHRSLTAAVPSAWQARWEICHKNILREIRQDPQQQTRVLQQVR